MIKVIDNVFNEKEIEFFYAEFRDNMSWKFRGEALDNTNWRKFHMFLNKEDSVHSKLFDKSNELFKKNLPSFSETHEIKNNYASGYLYGTHHEIHKDYDEGGYTIMFYLNKIWDVSYGGETIFVNNLGDITNSIIPKPGRVAIFDGSIPHAAREVSRICVELRMVATFKYGHK
tara:strand:+ start:342 stop:860 length:519 start_codon:yes stop_codon:yes gene_type:complete